MRVTESLGDALELWVPCPNGIENVLAEELRVLGAAQVRPLKAGVACTGGLQVAYRICLWSRVASRVLLVVGHVDCGDADALYQGIFSLPWERHLDPKGTFAVRAVGTNQALRNTQFSAVKTKDAICDRMRNLFSVRPVVDPQHPDVLIDVSVHEKRASISIDLAGESLHRRTWRSVKKEKGPLSARDALSAATLLASGWPAIAKGGGTFIDPMCGSGALVIEACMIAGDVAPQRMRTNWGFRKWLGHSEELWNQLVAEAHSRAEAGLTQVPYIYASDISPAAIKNAAADIKKAGLSSQIKITRCDVADLLRPQAPTGLLACEFPYGDQLAAAPALSHTFALKMRKEFGGYRLALIAPDISLLHSLGIQGSPVAEFTSGKTVCPIYVVEEIAPEEQNATVIEVGGKEVLVADGASAQFAACLTKAYEERSAWAQEQGISCYRVYDTNLNEYNMSIELFTGTGKDAGKRWVQVCEYAAPKNVDPVAAATRMQDALVIIPAVFDVPASCVFFKTRARAKGGSQYAKGGAKSSGHGNSKHDKGSGKPQRNLVEEDYLTFEVDFTGHLDCGLFLDTRLVRELIFEKAEGVRFLNLFAYTGTASVHAAAGGAYQTTTVDISQNYLDWAQANMRRNGFINNDKEEACKQEFVRADCLEWIQQMRQTGNRWDLIYCDPPTFSNSKKMHGRFFDVQQDHAELLIGMSRLLTRQGQGIFVCNLRGFKPDLEYLEQAGVKLEDITEQTIPADFTKTAHVHHCYLVTRGIPPKYLEDGTEVETVDLDELARIHAQQRAAKEAETDKRRLKQKGTRRRGGAKQGNYGNRQSGHDNKRDGDKRGGYSNKRDGDKRGGYSNKQGSYSNKRGSYGNKRDGYGNKRGGGKGRQ